MVDRAEPTPDQLPLATLFRYQGLVRDLVLRAKVGGDHRALALIEEILATSPVVGRAVTDCDALMACPSSLWGRWHGRLDIAGCVATRLAVDARKRLLPAPPELFWRWRKQALSHGSSARPASQLWRGPWPERAALRWTTQMASLGDPSTIRILMIDDVVTTGKTLDRCAATLAEHGFESCRALTFAAAPHLAISDRAYRG